MHLLSCSLLGEILACSVKSLASSFAERMCLSRIPGGSGTCSKEATSTATAHFRRHAGNTLA
eukprot:5520694-Amphidinium_carterae.1